MPGKLLSLLPLLPILLGGFGLAYLLLRGETAHDREMARLRRLSQFHGGKSDDPAADSAAAAAGPQSPLARGIGLVLGVLARIPIVAGGNQEKMRQQLKAAGFDQPVHLQAYSSIKLLMACLLAVPALWFHFLATLLGPGPVDLAASTLVGALIGGMAPDIMLDRLGRRRRALINAALPDALDLLCICTNAGYSLDLSIERVAREMEVVAPALCRELTLTSHELRLMPDRQMALRNFAERTDLPAARSLVVTLIQTQKFGTPLTVALKTLAEAERKTRMIMIEEQAAKLPAIITLPLMLFILPTVFIIVGTPAALQVMRTLK